MNSSLKDCLPAPHRWLGIGALTALLAGSGCGGSSSTTALKNDLPSPVANAINGEVLVPAPAGKDPAPQAELESLPIITLSPRQLADPNVLLNLRASVTAAAGATIVKTLWTQVGGPLVTIPAPLQLNNEILIPDVTSATTLEFRLTAQDSNGKINSATVSILVKPVNTFIRVSGGTFTPGNHFATFTLRLNAPSSHATTVTYTTEDGTATRDSDYVFKTGTLVFEPGEVSRTLDVILLDNVRGEDSESFSLLATVTDGTVTYSHSGAAIIRNTTTYLPQTLQFTQAEATPLYINSQFSNPLVSSPGTGAVVYSSSNPQVATVDANGTVTALAAGTTIIGATKARDDIYDTASTSYNLVVTAGMPPYVGIHTGAYQGDRFAQVGEPLTLYASDYLTEYGNPASYSWTSTLDNHLSYLGSGTTLYTSSLAQGLHLITESVTSSEGPLINKFLLSVGDLAHQAGIVNTIPAACEYLRFYNNPYAMVDLYLRPQIYDVNCTEGVSTLLTWAAPVVIDKIHLYLRTDLPTQNYIVEYFDRSSETWKALTMSDGGIYELDNTEANSSTRLHYYPAGHITTQQVRIWQPQYGSINELAVFGTDPNAAPSLVTETDINPISVLSGDQLLLTGTAFDPEDGELPIQTQTNRPLWNSTIDGDLTEEKVLTISSLSLGLHTLTFSASDTNGNKRSATVPVLVGNIAPAASVSASTTRCWNDSCYSPTNINDNRLSIDPGIKDSWINSGLELLGANDEEWIALSWSTPITTQAIDLYTTQGQVLQSYEIEYLNANSWVKLVSVTDNTSTHRSHSIPPITTRELRVRVLKGSVEEPGLARINEVVVFGTQAAATPTPVSSSSASSSAASSIMISSEATSSPLASSSTASSSAASSSLLSSSFASSANASSSTSSSVNSSSSAPSSVSASASFASASLASFFAESSSFAP